MSTLLTSTPSPAYMILERWTGEANERRLPPHVIKTMWRAWDIVEGKLPWTEQDRATVLAFLRTMNIRPERAGEMAQVIREIEAAERPKEE